MGELEGLEPLLGGGPRRPAAHAEVAPVEVQVVADRQAAVERGALRDDAARLPPRAGLAAMSTSATDAVPALGTIRVGSIPTVVVFPAPLGPRRQKISPARTVRSRPSTAVTDPG